jgi:hypothetical protein
MANLFVTQQADIKYGGKEITQVDQATQNAQLAEVLALAHSHANKALLDTYNFSNADVLDAIAKKHEPVTVAAGNPFGLSGQELSFLYDDAYLQILSNELSVKAGDLLLGANTNGLSKTGTGKTLGSDITLNLPQRIDTAATVQFAKQGIGGAAPSSVYISKIWGSENITGDLIVDGNLTINGDTVVLNAYELDIEDKNIILGNVVTPTDTTANGGGFTLKGASDKTLIWDSTYQNWTSSEHVNVASGKSYKVNNTVVVDSSRVGYLTKLNVNGPADTANALNLNGNGKVWGDLFSDNFNSVDPYLGYYIGRSGSIFSKITATEMHVKNFITDLEFGFAGGMIIVKSVAELAADFTVGGNLQLKEYEGYSGRLMQDNDFVRLRNQTRGETSMSVTDIWGQVVYVSRNSTTKIQTYTFTKISGSGTGASKGTLALDYGTAGNGGLELVAINELGKLPYFQTFSYATNPWTDNKINDRFGDLTGITTTTWGALSGKNGLYANVAYLEDDIYIGDTAVIGGVGVGMLNGMTALFHFDDNLYDSFNRVKPVYSGTYSETSYGLITATGLIATKAAGKFGGGIAVEETTTNTGANVYFDSADGNPATSGPSWTNYSAGTGAGTRTFSYAASGIHNIKKALRLTKTGGTTSSDRIGVYQSNAAWNSVTHTFSFYVKILSKEAGCRLRLFNGSANVQTWLLDDYAVGQWIRLSGTTNYAGSLRYIWLDTGNADVLITAFQAEAKSYATSFCEGTRAAGSLSFSGLINPSAFTVSARVYINFSAQAGFGRVFEISSDANNRLFVAQNSTSNFLRLYFMKSGTVIFDLITSTLSITADWHLISLKYDGANYYLFVDGAQIYSPLSSTLIDSAWTLKLGYGVTGTYLNAIFDETAIYNRAITSKEEQRIHHSNQPFNESAGLTVISGNQIKTGIIQSENYVIGTSGSMWNLNTGYLETADGWFRGTITASAGTIGGWNIDSHQINNSVAGVNGYAIVLDTITTIASVDYTRPRLAVTWGDGTNVAGWGGNFITLGAASYVHTANGAFTTTGWNVEDASGGLAININGKNVLFAGKRGAVVGAAIASFMFDDKELSLSKNIGGTDYKIIRLGDFTPAYNDIYTNQTSNFDDVIFEDGTKDNWGAAYGDAYWTVQSKWDTSASWTGYGSSSYALQLQELSNSVSGLFYYYNNFTGTPLNALLGRYIRITYSFRQKATSVGASARDIVLDFYNDGGSPVASKTHLKGEFTSNVTLTGTVSFFVPSGTNTITARIWFSQAGYSGTFYAVQFSGFKVERLEAMQININADGFEAYGGPDNRIKLSGAGSIFKVPLLETNTLAVSTWKMREHRSNDGTYPFGALVFQNDNGVQAYVHPTTGAWVQV